MSSFDNFREVVEEDPFETAVTGFFLFEAINILSSYIYPKPLVDWHPHFHKITE